MTKLRAMLREDEGTRLFVYDDATGLPIIKGSVVKGNPTIAMGRCLSTAGISPAEADLMLDNDITRFALAAKSFPWFSKLSETRQDVIIAMLFQMGGKGLLEFPKMIAALERKDYATAATEMLDSDWHRKQAPARSAKLSKMMSTDAYP